MVTRCTLAILSQSSPVRWVSDSKVSFLSSLPKAYTSWIVSPLAEDLFTGGDGDAQTGNLGIILALLT